MDELKNRAHQVLDTLHYDFTQFQIGHFIHHIQTLRGRPIRLYRFPFALDVFGLWAAGHRMDYLVYRSTLCQVHRDHTLLHEIGHMLLGHRRTLFEGALGDSLAQVLGEADLSGRLRSAPVPACAADPEEVECEMFVLLLQAQVTHASRLDALTGTSSSIDPLRPFMEAMAFAQEQSPR